MRKFIITGTAVAMLAVPTSAMADSTMVVNPDSPAGQDTFALGDTNNNALLNGEFDGSAMGFYNSRVTGNGSYISAQAHDLGGRGAAIQDTLGHVK